jgi:hypothetical protein
MTLAQQRRFYFPHWNACAAANDWIMVRGRLLADLAQQRGAEGALRWPEPALELYVKVIVTAEHLALQDHCAVTDDHLRHACNLVATGIESSVNLDNKQTNRVVVLFRLLKDPDDLDAVMDWLNPANADRRSFVAFLKKKAPEGIIIAICKNAFGTIFWEDLEIAKLRWLAKQLKDRTDSFHRPTSTNYLNRRREYETDKTKVPY